MEIWIILPSKKANKQTKVCVRGAITLTKQTQVCVKGTIILTKQTKVCVRGAITLTKQTKVCVKGAITLTRLCICLWRGSSRLCCSICRCRPYTDTPLGRHKSGWFWLDQLDIRSRRMGRPYSSALCRTVWTIHKSVGNGWSSDRWRGMALCTSLLETNKRQD